MIIIIMIIVNIIVISVIVVFDRATGTLRTTATVQL